MSNNKNENENPNQREEPPRRFYMDKTEEVADAQERYRSAPMPVIPAATRSTAAGPAPLPAHPPVAATADAPVRPVDVARLAAAVAALALVAAFFVPAIRDAIDRKRRAAAPTAPTTPATQRMYLLVNATPRGATVLLDGAEAGQTPLATNVECIDGAPIRVEISARGFAPYSAEVRCEAGGDAEVSPALQRDAGGR